MTTLAALDRAEEKKKSRPQMEAVEYIEETPTDGHLKRTDLEPDLEDDVDDEEQAQPTGNPPKEKSQHAGFWEHSMVNVRLHVLKLWVRTGKAKALYLFVFFCFFFTQCRTLIKKPPDEVDSIDTLCRHSRGSVDF